MRNILANEVSHDALIRIVDSSPNGVLLLSAVRDHTSLVNDFVVVYVNPAGCLLLSSNANELRQKRLSAIVQNEFNWLSRFRKVVETGEADRFDLPFSMGSISNWYDCSVVKQDDGVVVSLTDITRQKQIALRADRMISRFHSLLNSFPGATCLLEATRNAQGAVVDFTFVTLNDNFSTLLEATTEQLLGASLNEYLVEFAGNGVFDAFVKVVETSKPYQSEIYLSEILAPGWFSIRAVRQYDGLVVTLLNITEYRLAKELSGQANTLSEAIREARQQVQELSGSKQLLGQIAESTPDIITIFDLIQKNVVYLNRTVPTLLGYTLEELSALDFDGRLRKVIHPDDQSIIWNLFQDMMDSSDDVVRSVEYRFIQKDGTVFWVRNRSKVFNRNPTGQVTHILSLIQDITPYKAAEQKLRDSEHFIRQVAESTPDVISVLDLVKKEFVYLNKKFGPDEELQCYSQTLASVHPDDRALVESYNESFLTAADGQINTVEYRIIDASDNIIWYRARGQVFRRDAAGNVTQRLCIAQDITLQIASNQKIRETADMLQAILDGAPVGIGLLEIIRDETGHTIDFRTRAMNPKFALRQGHPVADMMFKSFSDLFPTIRRSDLFSQLVRVADSGLSIRKEMYINGGRAKGWFQISAVLEGDQLIVTSVDISDRKQAEDTIQQMLNGSMAAIAQLKAVRDTDRNLVDFVVKAVNAAGEEMVSLPAEDLIGQPVQDLLSDDLAPLFSDFEEVVNTGQPQRMQFELHYEQVDYWFDLSVVKQDDGVILTCLDVSETRRAQQQLEITLQQLQRSYDMLEHFALIASYELQEPLRKIYSFGDALVNQYSEQLSSEGADLVYRMHKSASRMQLLIKDLLTYSRLSVQRQPFRKINLAQTLHEVILDLEELIQEKRAQVIIESLPFIKGDLTQCRLLFYNILTNALKFSKPDLAPEVVVQSRTVAGNLIENVPGLIAGERYYEISVSDNGIGFEQKQQERIFAPFHRLNAKGGQNGTGIGLAICKRIIENHNGAIVARGAPDLGASFLVYIPVAEARRQV